MMCRSTTARKTAPNKTKIERHLHWIFSLIARCCGAVVSTHSVPEATQGSFVSAGGRTSSSASFCAISASYGNRDQEEVAVLSLAVDDNSRAVVLRAERSCSA
jgi:hypothetical protein